ncbi:cytochrome b/b6 domain-containing protein [Bartonella sp. HY038]|uniref:cytochrome b/b6 domain-containing protein n=1 Tax=Bartonella sp. HY038 TaxID=2759660 RepID=UPI0015F7BAD1|nr:cytochrome b/b6 domain-containing protein [Bartonella sp. HY038]
MSNHSQTKLLGYSTGAMILHWLIAALILLNIAGGFLMVRLGGISDSTRFYVFQWHKTLGLLVLFLTLARIAWRLMNKPPKKGPMLKIEALAASAVSIFFYGLMLAVPLLGWVVVSTTTVRIPTFLFLSPSLPWPNLPFMRNEAFSHLALNAHMLLAYAFVLLLFLHVAGAVKHSLIDRQAEFSRMLPTKRLAHLKAKAFSWPVMLLVVIVPALIGVIIAQRQTINQLENQSAASSAAPIASQSNAGNWVINMDKSTLGYSLDFSGTAKQGKVGNWHADVTFAPDQLENAKAEIVLAASSISYEDSFVSGSIADPDGLDPTKYPEIRVLLDKFSADGENFLGKGTITIRGVSQPIEVPFSFTNNNGIAKVSGSAKIERLLFGIGAQNDGDGSWLGKVINVNFSLEAEEKK